MVGAPLLPHVHSAQNQSKTQKRRAWPKNPLCKLARACCEDPRGTEGPLKGVGGGGEVKLGKIQLGELVSHLGHCSPLLPMCTTVPSPARLTSAHVISTDRSLWRERLHVLGLE